MSADQLAERHGLLNDYTREVLREAAEVERTLTGGRYLKVSADSDVVLHRPDGHWIGLRLLAPFSSDPSRRRWEGWRGSLFGDGEQTEWPTLGAAVEFYAAKESVNA